MKIAQNSLVGLEVFQHIGAEHRVDSLVLPAIVMLRDGQVRAGHAGRPRLRKVREDEETVGLDLQRDPIGLPPPAPLDGVGPSTGLWRAEDRS